MSSVRFSRAPYLMFRWAAYVICSDGMQWCVVGGMQSYKETQSQRILEPLRAGLQWIRAATVFVSDCLLYGFMCGHGSRGLYFDDDDDDDAHTSSSSSSLYLYFQAVSYNL